MDDGKDQQPAYVAHTPNAMGKWHGLREHLLGVARRASDFARPIGLEEIAYWAGLFHDLGKYAPSFQGYLAACYRADQQLGPRPLRGSAPHKQAGAVLAAEKIGGLLLAVILGHHGGIPCFAEAKGEILRQQGPHLDALFAVASHDCPELRPLPNLNAWIRQRATSKLEMEVLMRMLFSCLVDADALDTEEHSKPQAAAQRQRSLPAIAELRETFTQNQSAKVADAKVLPVNAIRREIYDACVHAAGLPPGVFKLTAPTGGGKTRSSLAFALEHARRYSLDRVIYALPYTSIVDQTTQEFEAIFGPQVVLEHHSNMEQDESDPNGNLWRRLASQNWDAPLVVTTTVQLFESFFGSRPARSRKVHRLARSVIVLDEVQTLPTQLLAPLVDCLRSLSERWGTTLLLCTATQPALDQQSIRAIGFTDVREIAPDPARLFAALRRVEYDLSPLSGEPWSWATAAGAMQESEQCLAILNTRKDAIALLEALPLEAIHLSSLLCGRHRRNQLAKIRKRLKAGEPCTVVATQVVEAGVDLDFPRVLRALGPLDRIVQAAGRCNREGERAEKGQVIVFQPSTGGTPRGSYAVALGVANRILRAAPDLHDHTIFEEYFRQVYKQDTLDARGVQKLREDLDFPKVAEKMRFIEETVPVLVRYEKAEEEIDGVLDAIRSHGRHPSSDLWRDAQPFLVSLSRREFDLFEKQGLTKEIVPGFTLWQGGYDDVRGLTAAAIEPSELII